MPEIECSSCQRPLQDTDIFCRHCGTTVTPNNRSCPSCNTELSEDAQFCSECGFRAIPADAEGYIQESPDQVESTPKTPAPEINPEISEADNVDCEPSGVLKWLWRIFIEWPIGFHILLVWVGVVITCFEYTDSWWFRGIAIGTGPFFGLFETFVWNITKYGWTTIILFCVHFYSLLLFRLWRKYGGLFGSDEVEASIKQKLGFKWLLVKPLMVSTLILSLLLIVYAWQTAPRLWQDELRPFIAENVVVEGIEVTSSFSKPTPRPTSPKENVKEIPMHPSAIASCCDGVHLTKFEVGWDAFYEGPRLDAIVENQSSSRAEVCVTYDVYDGEYLIGSKQVLFFDVPSGGKQKDDFLLLESNESTPRLVLLAFSHFCMH